MSNQQNDIYNEQRQEAENEMEGQINFLTERAWEEIQSGLGVKLTIKAAVCDAFKAGLESAQKIYKS